MGKIDQKKRAALIHLLGVVIRGGSGASMKGVVAGILLDSYTHLGKQGRY